MSERFFRKFPRVRYDGFTAVNLTAAVALLDSVIENPYVFYPYDVLDGERADQISDRYYEDQFLSWLIYMSMGLIDPYYGWYMDHDEFTSSINYRYGSVAQAHQKVIGYRCNWYSDDSVLTPGRYEVLDPQELKYWEPIRGSQNKITGYRRAKREWNRETNRLVSYEANGSSFVMDERVSVTVAPSYTGAGHVTWANSTSVILKHVVGYYDDSEVSLSGAYLYGNESKANSSFTESPVTRAELILPEEEIYWSPVTAFEKEEEKNTENRSIRILDSRFAMQASLSVTRLLGNNVNF